ncbi:MAG: hypothetical protein ACXVCI_14140, partial [Bdellovibrionota bacterium]
PALKLAPATDDAAKLRETRAVSAGLNAAQDAAANVPGGGQRVFEISRVQSVAGRKAFVGAYLDSMAKDLGKPADEALRARAQTIADLCHAGAMCAGHLDVDAVGLNISPVKEVATGEVRHSLVGDTAKAIKERIEADASGLFKYAQEKGLLSAKDAGIFKEPALADIDKLPRDQRRAIYGQAIEALRTFDLLADDPKSKRVVFRNIIAAEKFGVRDQKDLATLMMNWSAGNDGTLSSTFLYAKDYLKEPRIAKLPTEQERRLAAVKQVLDEYARTGLTAKEKKQGLSNSFQDMKEQGRERLAKLLVACTSGLGANQKELENSCREAAAHYRGPSPDNHEGMAHIEVTESTSMTDLLRRYKALNPKINQGSGLDTQMDLMRFVAPEDFAKASNSLHGEEIYGVKNYVAWKDAKEYLETIPKGKFEPTPEVINKVRTLVSGGPDKGGAVRPRGTVSQYALTHPLNEEEYKAVMSNKYLNGFAELPFLSGPGERRGWIQFPRGPDAEARLQKLNKWYSASKDKLDPIELAAKYQHGYVSIEGDGRTGRLLMDRILQDHGLPPAILADPSRDILMPVDKYVDAVREGVDRYLTVAEVGGAGSIDVTRNSGLRVLNLASAKDQTLLKQIKEIPESRRAFTADGKTFRLDEADGFFYDVRGVPHVAHDGSLYPLTDRGYRLLEMNVDRTPAMVKTRLGRVSQEMPGEKVELSPAHKEYVTANIDLLKGVRGKKIDAADIKVLPYADIADANAKGELHLYPWQKEAFAHAAKIDATDPVNIMRPFRAQKTAFDAAAIQTPRVIKPYAVLAQYEMADRYYYDLEQVARKQFPDLVGTVTESRRKLHDAGRTLLAPYLEARKKIDPAHSLMIANDNSVKLFDAYLEHSKLVYEDFDKALRSTDDSVMYLMRSDTTAVNAIGFLSHADFVHAVDKLPMSSQLKDFTRKLSDYLNSPEGRAKFKVMFAEVNKKLEDKDSFWAKLPASIKKSAAGLEVYYDDLARVSQYAAGTLFSSKYTSRAAGPEFERAFISQVLHASGGSFKEEKSFTTSPKLMEGFPYTFAGLSHGELSDITPQISLVKVPKSAATVNFGSDTFPTEYEILVNKPLSPFSIVEKFNPKDLPPPLAQGAYYPDEVKSFVMEFFDHDVTAKVVGNGTDNDSMAAVVAKFASSVENKGTPTAKDAAAAAAKKLPDAAVKPADAKSEVSSDVRHSLVTTKEAEDIRSGEADRVARERFYADIEGRTTSAPRENYGTGNFFDEKERLWGSSERSKIANDEVLKQLSEIPHQRRIPSRKAGLADSELRALYDKVANNPVSALCHYEKYDPQNRGIGYCFGRAMTVHLEALIGGLQKEDIKKIWSVGNLKNEGTSWRYHVSTIVRGKDGEWYAIDPIMDKPMKVGDWRKQMQTYGDDSMRIFVTDPQRAAPSSRAVYNNARNLPANGDVKRFHNDLMDYFREESKSLAEKAPSADKGLIASVKNFIASLDSDAVTKAAEKSGPDEKGLAVIGKDIASEAPKLPAAPEGNRSFGLDILPESQRSKIHLTVLGKETSLGEGSAVFYKVKMENDRLGILKVSRDRPGAAHFLLDTDVDTVFARSNGVPVLDSLERGREFGNSVWLIKPYVDGPDAASWLAEWRTAGANREDPKFKALQAIPRNLDARRVRWDGTEWKVLDLDGSDARYSLAKAAGSEHEAQLRESLEDIRVRKQQEFYGTKEVRHSLVSAPSAVSRGEPIFSAQDLSSLAQKKPAVAAAVLYRNAATEELAQARHRYFNGKISLKDLDRVNAAYGYLETPVTGTSASARRFGYLRQEENYLARLIDQAKSDKNAGRVSQLQAAHAAVSTQLVGELSARSASIGAGGRTATEARKGLVESFSAQFERYQNQFPARSFQQVVSDPQDAKLLQALIARDALLEKQAAEEARASLTQALSQVASGGTASSRDERAGKMAADVIAIHDIVATDSQAGQPSVTRALRDKAWTNDEVTRYRDSGLSQPWKSVAAGDDKLSAATRGILFEDEMARAETQVAQEATEVAKGAVKESVTALADLKVRKAAIDADAESLAKRAGAAPTDPVLRKAADDAKHAQAIASERVEKLAAKGAVDPVKSSPVSDAERRATSAREAKQVEAETAKLVAKAEADEAKKAGRSPASLAQEPLKARAERELGDLKGLTKEQRAELAKSLDAVAKFDKNETGATAALEHMKALSSNPDMFETYRMAYVNAAQELSKQKSWDKAWENGVKKMLEQSDYKSDEIMKVVDKESGLRFYQQTARCLKL